MNFNFGISIIYLMAKLWVKSSKLVRLIRKRDDKKKARSTKDVKQLLDEFLRKVRKLVHGFDKSSFLKSKCWWCEIVSGPDPDCHKKANKSKRTWRSCHQNFNTSSHHYSARPGTLSLLDSIAASSRIIGHLFASDARKSNLN